MKDGVITFKVSSDFKKHIENQALKKKLKPSQFIREVLKKYTKFKEKELV